MKLERRNYGRGHSYYLDGQKLPGVTTLIGQVDKPFLVGWAARMAAQYATDNWDELAHRPLSERGKLISNAHRVHTSEAAAVGTAVHAAIERLGAGKTVSASDPRVADRLRNFVPAWKALGVKLISAEQPVASSTMLYAGTYDMLCTLGGQDQPVLLDVKTGSRVYPETLLQLAAYSMTDVAAGGPVLGDLGIERVGVLHVTEQSTSLYMADVTPEERRMVGVLSELWQARQAIEDHDFVLQSAFHS